MKTFRKIPIDPAILLMLGDFHQVAEKEDWESEI